MRKDGAWDEGPPFTATMCLDYKQPPVLCPKCNQPTWKIVKDLRTPEPWEPMCVPCYKEKRKQQVGKAAT